MKKIINGKKYDTSTAKQIAWADHPQCGERDFHYWIERLYKKRTGEFFLHGEGHGFSKYAKKVGNTSGWGQKIIPLTEVKAKEWAEEWLSTEEYEAIFGETSE